MGTVISTTDMPRPNPEVVFAKLEALIRSEPLRAFFNPPASLAAIRRTERKLGLRLPATYKEFLLRHDGGFFSLTGKEGDDLWDKGSSEWNSNVLFGLGRLAKEFNDQKTQWKVDIGWEGEWDYIPVCQTSGQELLVFDSTEIEENERAVLDAWHEVWPAEWRPVYPTFLHLLQEYVFRRGKIETIGKLLSVTGAKGNKMSDGKFILHRFNGSEEFEIQMATIHAVDEEGGLRLWFEAKTAGVCLKSLPDTVDLNAMPKAEVCVALKTIDPDKLVGSRFSVPSGYDEAAEEHVAAIYYLEHEDMDDNEIEVLGREGDEFDVRWTATTADVNDYDGSKPAIRVEIKGKFKFKDMGRWVHPSSDSTRETCDTSKTGCESRMKTEYGELRSLSDIVSMLPHDSWAAERYAYRESLGEENVLLVTGDLVLKNLDLDDLLGGDSTGPAPYLILVTGNLTISGPIYNVNTDGATGLIVLGDLAAENMVVGGQQVYVGGTLRVANLFWGDYNHGELRVKGDAEARVMSFTGEYHVSIGGRQQARFLLDEAREDEGPIDFSYDGLSLIFEQGLLLEDGDGEGFLSSLIDRDAVIQSLREGLPVARADSEVGNLLPPTAEDLFTGSEISIPALLALVYGGLIETGQTTCEGAFRDTDFRIGMRSMPEDGEQRDDRVFFTVGNACQFYLGVTEIVSQEQPTSRTGGTEPIRELEMVYRSIAEGEDDEWKVLTPETHERTRAACRKAWCGLLDYARKGIAQQLNDFPLWQQVRTEVTCERLEALISLPIFTERYNDWWDQERHGYWSGYLWFGARQAVMLEGEQLTSLLKIAWKTGSVDETIGAYWFEYGTTPDGVPLLNVAHSVSETSNRRPVPRHAADHLARILRFMKSAEEKIAADNAHYLAERARSDDLEATTKEIPD